MKYPYRNRRKRHGLRLNLICGIINFETINQFPRRSTVYKSVEFPDGSVLTAAQADGNAEYIVAFEIQGKTTLPNDFQIVME